MTIKTTKQVDYRPFLIHHTSKDNNEQVDTFPISPIFLGSTSYNTMFANWGSKKFERVRNVDKKLLDFKFKGQSSYTREFSKAEEMKLPPKFETEYDEKFMKEMKKKN